MGVPDPEVLFGKLTSGDAARILAVADAATSARAKVDTAMTGMDDGLSTAVDGWRGPAASEFLGSARDLNAGAGVDHAALGRVLTTVVSAATAYAALETAAPAIIKPWRDRDPALDGAARNKLAFQVNVALAAAAQRYQSALVASLEGLRPTDEADPLDWFRRLILGNSVDGPVIPNTLASGDEDGEWIPQGLAYNKDADQLLVSYYSGHSDTDSLLSVIDENSGEEVGNVRLGGVPLPVPFSDIDTPPNHSGGVAVDGDNVWVTSTEGKNSYVYQYSMAEIQAAENGEEVPAVRKIPVGASSYATFADGKLWVGSFKEKGPGLLYGYDVNADGEIADEPSTTVSAPPQTQGVVVRDDEFVFSQSYGRNNLSSLITQSRDDPLGLNRESTPLPNMAEGIAEVDGDILTLYESGAEEYANGSWPRDRFTRTPIEDLTGEGYELDPAALTSAAGFFDTAGDALADAAGEVTSTQLVASVLGEVPAAAPYATAVTAYLTAIGKSLSARTEAVHGVADGLLDNASTYQLLEDSALNLFGLGQS